MIETIDPQKIAYLAELAKQADIDIRVLKEIESLEVVLTDKKLTLPLTLARALDDLRRPEEMFYENELFERVLGRALYEGFVTVEALGDDHGDPDRLLGGFAFIGSDGQVLTFERHKSYVDTYSSRYVRSRYFDSADQMRVTLTTRRGQKDIFDFLKIFYSENEAE